MALFNKKNRSGGLQVKHGKRENSATHINTKSQGVGISKDHRGVGIGAKPVQLKSKRIRA